MKKLIFLLLILSYVALPQKSVLTQKQKDSIRVMIGYINVKDYGAVGDGLTEDSTAFKNALQYLFDKGGGTLFIPEGVYLISSRLVLPYSGTGLDGAYLSKSIIMQGDGNYANSTNGNTGNPSYGSVLKLAYSGSDEDLILALGAGTLKITGLTLWTDIPNKNILKIISTITYVSNCTFYGDTTGVNASNDAIIFGGVYPHETYGEYAITDSSGFQGYGTVVKDNYFYRIRRAGYFQTYANGIQFINNTIWNSCGSNVDSVAAIELSGDPLGYCVGNYISGNLIEGTHYNYGIKLKYAVNNSILSNNIYDQASNSLASYRFDDYAQWNTLISGAHSDTYEFYTEDATANKTNHITNSHAAGINTIPYSNTLRVDGVLDVGVTSSLKWADPLGATEKVFSTSINYTGENRSWYLNWLDSSGATNSIALSVSQYSGGGTTLWGTNQASLNIANGTSDGNIRLQAGATGTLWLGSSNKIYETGGQLFSTLSTGTAPLSITSTTPVDNLTVKRLGTPSFIGSALTDLDMGNNNVSAVDSLTINTVRINGIKYDTTGVIAGEVYTDNNTGILRIAIGENLVSNGTFDTWNSDGTGDMVHPLDWAYTREGIDSSIVYIENSPVGSLHFVSDGSGGAIYQLGTTAGRVYGYSFDITESVDTALIYIGGVRINSNYELLPAGHYSGQVTAISTYMVTVTRNVGYGTASDMTFDNFKVWEIGGDRQAVQPLILVPDTTGITDGYTPKYIGGAVVWSPDVSTSGTGTFNPDGVTIDTTAGGLARVLPAKVTKWDSVTVLTAAVATKLNISDTTAIRTFSDLKYAATASFAIAPALLDDSLTAKMNRSEMTGYSTTSHTHTDFFDTLTITWGVLDTTYTGSLSGWKVPNDITITEISAYTDANTCTFNLEERAETTPNTAGTDVMGTDLVADTNQEETSTFTNATIAKNTWLVPTISATGDVSIFSISVRYIKTD